ncbi:MAG: sulfotransferase domain-containing protein [Verrucomicrobia bacterium]|nr:sulfotransferase domain-containing protein [Verrucomicrobiota bacterium]
MSFPIRRNFSRHARAFRAADAYVVSIQKAGRTWVRVFLEAYFDAWRQAGGAQDRPAPPTLHYTHDLWEFYEKVPRYERLRGKWLIPPGDARRKLKLLVARDPRDVMVSLYFHLTKRSRRFEGDISALLRDPQLGVAQIVGIMNRWLREWRGPRLHILRYEDARHNPRTAFAAAIRFLLPAAEPDPVALAQAIELSSFENMHRLEAHSADAKGSLIVARAGLDKDALRPADAADANSFKTRRGKVGGYVDYLNAEDIAFLHAEVAKLDPRYGYGGRRS